MNTYVLYAISIVLIIALIYFMTRRPPRLDPLQFDSINGHPNVVKNLRIKPGLIEISNGVSIDVDDEINGRITVGGINTSISTLSDLVLSKKTNVIIITSGYDSAATYSSRDRDDRTLFNRTKDYIFTGYVKRLSTSENDTGRISWIPIMHQDGFIPINGSAEWVFTGIDAKDLTPNEWHLMVGVTRHVGSEFGKVSDGTGIHRLSDRKKISDFSEDYIMTEGDKDTGSGVLGNFTNVTLDIKKIGQLNTKVSFTKPFIFEVDGDATDSIVNGIVETMLGGKK
jgi:hypothetical protein